MRPQRSKQHREGSFGVGPTLADPHPPITGWGHRSPPSGVGSRPQSQATELTEAAALLRGCPVTRKSARCHLIRPVRSFCQESWPAPGLHGGQEAGDAGSRRTTHRAVITGNLLPWAVGGPASMTRRRPPSCHRKRPAQVKATPPGGDNCHRTGEPSTPHSRCCQRAVLVCPAQPSREDRVPLARHRGGLLVQRGHGPALLPAAAR